MCGIAGIFHYKNQGGEVELNELLRIRDAMLRRGPDGAGIWISSDQKVGLAHRRLSIIDLSEAGSQPMFNSDRSLGIVFNGEIYNYRELRKTLELKGYQFHSQSDTEVLLHLYAEMGPRIVDQLRGMYAFAIWDQKKQGIFMARDPLGIKPLYFSDDGCVIRFASQVKALLKTSNFKKTPEPAGYAGFFLMGSVPEPYTLYKSIRALPAGSWLWVNKLGERAQKTYFNIAREFASINPADIDHEEACRQLREHLFDSVTCHMVADVPVGVFLSGGLDSTTLAALAIETGAENLRTITLGFNEFKGGSRDETPLAQIVAEHYGTIHTTRWVDKEYFRDELDQLFEAMDQPTIDGVNTYFVSKQASMAGLKVILSGIGGDELFAGYPSFVEIPRLVKQLAPLQGIPLVGELFLLSTAPFFKRFSSPKYAGLLKYGSQWGGAYLLRRGLFMPWELVEIMGSEMAKEGLEELQLLTRLEETTANIANDRMKVTSLEMNWYLRNQLLRDTDWAGMAHSLEIRTPLVDAMFLKKIMPYLASKHALGKRDMARVPAKALPKVLFNRPKTGFNIPIHEWLLQSRPEYRKARGYRGWANVVLESFS